MALSEMAFAGGLGAEVSLEKVSTGEAIQRDDILLFSESNSRFLAEVERGKREEFENTLRGNDFAVIGNVNGTDTLRIKGLNGKSVISLPLKTLKEAWQRPIRW